MKRKIGWRSLKFIPTGGDESQAICRKENGFMHLCEQFRYGSSFPDYTIHDTKGMFRKYGYNNIDIDWSDFRKALIKFQLESPPEKPSMFHGESSRQSTRSTCGEGCWLPLVVSTFRRSRCPWRSRPGR